jgi:hypothetical protein
VHKIPKLISVGSKSSLRKMCSVLKLFQYDLQYYSHTHGKHFLLNGKYFAFQNCVQVTEGGSAALLCICKSKDVGLGAIFSISHYCWVGLSSVVVLPRGFIIQNLASTSQRCLAQTGGGQRNTRQLPHANDTLTVGIDFTPSRCCVENIILSF